jgi:hypothetical protein
MSLKKTVTTKLSKNYIDKGKDFFMIFLTKHHAIKANRGVDV